MRMFSRMRGKKALERLRANAAACVSARLRPCCAKRSGPKISDRLGRSSGPRLASRISPSSAGASGTSRSRSDALIRWLYDQRGHPEGEGDEGDHRVGGALEAEHPAA